MKKYAKITSRWCSAPVAFGSYRLAMGAAASVATSVIPASAPVTRVNIRWSYCSPLSLCRLAALTSNGTMTDVRIPPMARL